MSREAPSNSLSEGRYVPDLAGIIRGLSRTQREYVKAGSIHGDCTMATVRALKSKHLFYLKITSPNGQCGHMELTPLGEQVQAAMKATVFQAWLREIDALARAEGSETPYTEQTGADCWAGVYGAGMTPAEAWAEEKASGMHDVE